MWKSELVALVHTRLPLENKVQAEEALNAVIDALKDVLEAGKAVSFMGFGSFKVVDRAERKARNPQTGEEMTIPAKKAVVFKPSKAFVYQLNNKRAA